MALTLALAGVTLDVETGDHGGECAAGAELYCHITDQTMWMHQKPFL